MPKVYAYYPPGNRYQWFSQGAFEREHQPEGWVLAEEGADMADVVAGVAPVAAEAEVSEPDPEAEAPAPKRGARAK